VLEPLAGYLTLAEKLWSDGDAFAEGWNFGPVDGDVQPVQWIVDRLATAWGRGASSQADGGTHPHEAGMLKLDIAKARHHLGWSPTWDLATALDRIVDWHRAWLNHADAQAACLAQIEQHTLATQQKAA
jgi:CDP-glucose 4,6-dehydratase